MKAISITAQALRFFVDMDWPLLARQKSALIRLSAETQPDSGPELEDGMLLDGLLNMVDGFQDFAVDGLGFHPDKVFSKEGEDEDLRD